MNFVLAAFISFLFTAISIPPIISLARKFNLVDNPKERPHPAHIQERVVPRAAGLACFLGIIFSISMFIQLDGTFRGIIISLLILLIVGLADDKFKNFSPYVRLILQFIAAFVAVIISNIGIQFITNPVGGIINLNQVFFTINFVGMNHEIILGDILSLIWIVWVMNMINWSKGVDGQMPTIAFSASVILGLLSLKLFLDGDLAQMNVATLSFITAGSSFALLLFNWYPARIFPGFSGSSILGFMIAILAILSGAKLATAGLVLLIPATDFAYTFVRRIIQGKSPVWGDRGHLHHKLLDMGLTHQKISLFYFLGSVILGAIALSLSSSGKLFAAILIAIIIFGTILWLNFFGGSLKHQDPDSG